MADLPYFSVSCVLSYDTPVSIFNLQDVASFYLLTHPTPIVFHPFSPLCCLPLKKRGVSGASGLKGLEAGGESHPGWEQWAGASASWDGLPRCKHIWSPSGRDLEHQDSHCTPDWGCEALRMSQEFPPTPTICLSFLALSWEG